MYFLEWVWELHFIFESFIAVACFRRLFPNRFAAAGVQNSKNAFIRSPRES